MAPKPRPIPRKQSVSNAVKTEQDAAKAMPPPPAPPAPGILVPEVTALSTCLKNAVVKTGQLYGFYTDTRKLGIQNYAPAPPQTLTSALGRELRAISVLQRDLAREERRIKEAEAEAEAKAKTIAGRTRSASQSPTSTRIPLPAIDLTAAGGDDSRPSTADPALSPALPGSSIAGRRPSAISISSLHRPNLPLKLDLSSSALRITPEEASLFSQGLSSPVTLAPRSARPYGPNELPPEIMAALASASSASDAQPRPVDIDLTSPDQPTRPDIEMTGIGNSADKPIELDLDAMEIDMAMSDLFGDADSGSNAGEGLFTPVLPGPDLAHSLGDGKIVKEEEESFLDALSGGGDDMFASLRANASGDTHGQQAASGSAPAQPMSAPSPGSLLASFSQQMGGDLSQQMGDEASGASNHTNLPSDAGGPTYDLDALDLTNLSPGFFGDTQNSDMNMGFDMEELLNMGGGGEPSTATTTTQEASMDPRVKTEHYVPGFGV
ncbi:hypothetical protein MVEN_01929500 [Mycena venus]|uniref:Uncharacterized protein n=1 Tax=Mycena venus TaxID=2733690 RepID=A0A8H6XGL3_9AGAR|nr:hypothetical protein MVEN_01929500 [Mycena venus]